MTTSIPWFAVAAACALAAAIPAQAGVVINSTRIIYPQREGEVAVQLTNKGDTPSRIKVWIDNGDGKADPAAFTLTPQTFRIDPGKSQALRLAYTRAPLPADRESVFWFNALEEPQQAEPAPGTNYLKLSYQTRIKLFFRPDGLAGKPGDAPARLQWTLLPNATGKVLHVSNPTAFHVSFLFAGVAADGVAYENGDGGMIDPGASLDIPVTRMDKPTPLPGFETVSQPVRFIWIDDYGATVSAQAPLDGGS